MKELVWKPRIPGRVLARGIAATLMLVTIARPGNCTDVLDQPHGVLERFVGTWTTETHIRNAGPPLHENTSREITTRGKATCRATLEGRYFEFRSETIPPENAELQIMTYDEGAGVYRQWVFSSDGYFHEAVGRWDAATSTLRWEGKSGDKTFVIDDHWVSPDRLEWTLRRTDARGNVLQTIEGTVMREVQP